MPKRPTSNPRRHRRANMLEVRVMSPRIAWCKFLTISGKITKIAAMLAIVAAICWGAWRGIESAFYQNQDFRLQIIDLNPNPAIDEVGLAEATDLDLTASIFKIDVDGVISKLKARPEISDVTAERHLPGTLMVRVNARTPKAWISNPGAGLIEPRQLGAMLVDGDGVAYPCPALQLESAAELPVIHIPLDANHPLAAGTTVTHPDLKHCFRLLKSASKADPQAIRWIESVRQVNPWSLELVTRQGTVATFGLGDHERQIASLQAAIDHSSAKGYSIQTINLIPKHNIPITLKSEPTAPRAIPVTEPSPAEIRNDRRTRDLSTLLNRN